MNPSREREQRPFPACGLLTAPLRPLQRGSPPSVPLGFEAKRAVRVKRRRSRRERNGARFGHSALEAEGELGRGLPKALPPFWGSQLRPGAQSTPVRGAKAVVITQRRLTCLPQHRGIFNREVKSADIERLLSPKAGPEAAAEVTPECGDGGTMQRGGGGGGEAWPDPHQPLSHEGSPCVEPNLSAAEEAAVDGPRLLVTPAALGVGSPATEAEAVDEKENVPPVAIARGTPEPTKGRFLAKELAQDLQRLLDLRDLFPGRSVVSEARQAVARALREQRKAWPGLDALASLRTLISGRSGGGGGGGGGGEALQAGLRSPSLGDQGLWPGSEPGCSCSNSSSRDSGEQGLPLRKRRGQEEPFLAGFLPRPGQTAEEGPDQRDSFLEPEVSFPCSQAPSQQANTFRIPFVSEEQLSQGSAEAPRGRRGRPQRPGVSALSRKPASRWWQRSPFAAHNPLDAPHLGADGDACLFLPMEPWAPSNRQNPEATWLRGAEPVPFLGSHLLDPGARNPDAQTSFDVLKSIWSPQRATKGPTPASRSLLDRQLSSSKEWQPKEFLQLYGLVPEQSCASSSRREAAGNDFVFTLAKPRTHFFAREQRRASLGWTALEETPEGSPAAGSFQAEGDLERLLRLQGAQQHLQAFQQLPMSCFPPSEALEGGRRVPACSFQGHLLLDQASPEPWAFPRMKLY